MPFDSLFRAALRRVALLENLKLSLSYLSPALLESDDFVDFDFNEVLAVALHLLVLLFALELEDEDLVSAAFAYNGGGDLDSGEVGDELTCFGGDCDDVGEFECAVLVSGGFDLQLLAWGDEVLFATGANDCVHS